MDLRSAYSRRSASARATMTRLRSTTGAHYAWRRLLNRYGEQPPGGPHRRGCACRVRLRLGGGAELGVGPGWRRPVGSSGGPARLRSYGPHLEDAAGMELPEAMARPRHNSGVSFWAAAATLQRNLGAPDALTLERSPPALHRCAGVRPGTRSPMSLLGPGRKRLRSPQCGAVPGRASCRRWGCLAGLHQGGPPRDLVLRIPGLR